VPSTGRSVAGQTVSVAQGGALMPKLASVRAASEAAAATLRPSGLPLRSWGAFLMTPDYSLPPGVGLSPRHAAAPSAAVVVGITHGIAGPGAIFTGQGPRRGVGIARGADPVNHIGEPSGCIVGQANVGAGRVVHLEEVAHWVVAVGSADAGAALAGSPPVGQQAIGIVNVLEDQVAGGMS